MEKWRLLDLSYPTVFENLALEEALYREATQESVRPTVRLWLNPPSAIVGRFQEVRSEVDTEFCRRNSIQIARRFTGGGAVYHDEGNVNVSLIVPRWKGFSISDLFKLNSSIVIGMLRGFGMDPVFDPPNSILISGRKISGAAAAANRQVALWHASILVLTDAATLEKVLSPGAQSTDTKYVRSARRPVTTLQQQVGNAASIDSVKLQLTESIEDLHRARMERDELTAKEQALMLELTSRKYSSAEWNLSGRCSTL